MSWNLHEPKPEQFDFSGNLDIVNFIEIAHELGLYVILRPGPYICAEWDFGGLPAWLLSDPNMEVRSNYPGYQTAAERYLNKVFELTAHLMASSSNGPIIAVQIENEFASYGNSNEHLHWMKDVILSAGVSEKLFTSDSNGLTCRIEMNDTTWKTANFASLTNQLGRGNVFDELDQCQTGRPKMVSEFWTGWFDHWGQNHQRRDQFYERLAEIMDYDEGSNVNFYMFFGGTNFGFMNGANSEVVKVDHDTTSYDYDALIAENGDMTEKFYAAQQVFLERGFDVPGFNDIPAIDVRNFSRKAYATIGPSNHMLLENVIKLERKVEIKNAMAAEFSPIDQSYGYTYYETTLQENGQTISGFHNNFRDRARVFINSIEVGFIDANERTDSIEFEYQSGDILGVLIENAGRVNFGLTLNEQRKGLFRNLKSQSLELINWSVYITGSQNSLYMHYHTIAYLFRMI